MEGRGIRSRKDRTDTVVGTVEASDRRNMWLGILKKDLQQSKYNLTKVGLYGGGIKEGVENLLKILKEDYEV